MKAIKTSVYNSNQSWYFEELRKLESGTMVHIEIRINAFTVQSYGKIELWDGSRWSLLYSIPGELLETKCSYVEKNVTASRFAEDKRELILLAQEILA